MNDKHIDELFNMDIPPADSNARKIAINSAVSEFSQGIQQSTRPIDDNNQSIWSSIMKLLSSQNSSKVFATVAVGFVAVSVVTLLPQYDAPPSNILGKVVTEPEANSGERIQRVLKPEVHTVESMNDTLEEVTVTARKESRNSVNVPMSIDAGTQEFEAHRSDAASAPVEAKKLAKMDLASEPQVAGKTKRVESLRQKNIKVFPKMASEFSSVAPASEALLAQPAPRPDLGEEYAQHIENGVKLVQEDPVSTFSIDVDSASYSLVRNQLKQGFLPSPTAVRSEEFINYFSYNYAPPKSRAQPFSSNISVFNSPWNEDKKLIHIGIKGYEIETNNIPDSNLVFLLDVSGSMHSQNKLPLVKQSMNLLLNTLKPSDTISIVVYAGAAGMVLEPTQVKDKQKIISAIQNLNAGGSTAGGQGIELAYSLAQQNFNKDAVNRIILATDGDFNVGLQSNDALKTLVERKRGEGIFLSVLGFGRNNYQDDMMQTLAQNGNGVAAYIDSLSEAKKVLVDEASSTLFTIAKDVKLQVEFNPETVSEYRLVGYETRALNREDFNNDKVDAGDIGSGHNVTAIYEITPTGAKASIDKLRYANNEDSLAKQGVSNEYGFLKIRYKQPDGDVSKLIEMPIKQQTTDANSDVEFSIAVASFAQLLKGGKYTGSMSFDRIAKQAQANKGSDPFGYRSEFIQLVRMAEIAKN